MENRPNWERTTFTVLSAQIAGALNVEVNLVRETLKQKLSLQGYVEACMRELEQNLENVVCIDSGEFRPSSGEVGVQKVCQWAATATEVYVQILGFILNGLEGVRLFCSISETQWKRHGKELLYSMQYIDLRKC